jgi:acyl transferase domain-containing protein/aryl carrier-like protein
VKRQPDDVRTDEQFARYGLTSLQATGLMAALSRALGRDVPVALLWAHPTIDALAAALASGATRIGGPDADTRSELPAPCDEPIAIVGVACRFPGGSDTTAFWRLLAGGGDAVVPVPADRWDVATNDGRDRTSGARPVPRQAGFLEGRIDEFDPLFFGISPREADYVDPQQRLFLEVVWEALEDAGLANEALKESRTGVFAGAIWHDYADLAARGVGRCSSHAATGRALNMVANRVSHALGLRGPSIVLDSACSSSLLAVHLACQSLRQGECEAAIAGGVNLLLSPETMVALTSFGGLSPDGRCKAFDARADGFGRGEGCGAIVLKPLSRALADGDDIWCTIRGSATNNDGPSNGLTAPNPLAQEDVLRAAYRDAGVAVGDVHYVEAHGAGTMLGDPIEAMALGAAISHSRTEQTRLRIGSVKTNLGHLEAAAGIAGLIKTVLCLRRGQIPPSVHFETPNPHIAFDELGISVQRELESWPADRPLLAGVSSFGWGGTNVHAVLAGWRDADAVSLAPSPRPRSSGRPRIAYVCSPHGHGWVGMGRLLYRTEPVFAASLRRCDRELARHTGWSVVDELFADGRDPRSRRIDVVQPVLFAIQVGLARWLEAAGAGPDAVVGHSVGELAAAAIAGVLDLGDAAQLVHHYTRQQQRVAGQGDGMAIIELSPAELQDLGYLDGAPVVVAAINGPRSTALAGDTAALEAIVAQLKARDVLCAMIRVDVAAHSPAVDPVLEDLRSATAEIVPRAGRIPMISTATGMPVDWRDVGGDYFARNLRQPVLLGEATRYLLEQGYDTLLEISAEPVLLSALQQSVEASGRAAIALGTMRRGDDDRSSLVETLDTLARMGADIALPGRRDGTRSELVTLSAKTPAALRDLAAGVATTVDEAAEPPTIQDLACAAARRADNPHRLAVVAGSAAELTGLLAEYAAGGLPVDLRESQRAVEAPPRIAFVFPGQGSQWLGMGRELLADEPVFHASIRACDAAASKFVNWSILSELEADEHTSRLDRIDVVQPILFAIQVSLATLWRSWGVQPDAVVGHSMGEVAAAHVAGALSLEDAARIICRRSRIMRRASGRGSMLAVELDLEDARRAIEGEEHAVSLAVNNSPRSTVLSGDTPTLERIAQALEAAQVFCRWVKVDVASHSPQMDPLRDDLLAALQGLAPRPAQIPIHSTVTGEVVGGEELQEAYWVRNLRDPVLFSAQILRLLQEDVTAFVEMSPHPVLLPAVEQVAAHAQREVAALASVRRQEPERRALLRSLGHLHVLGVPLAEGSIRPAGRRPVKLPHYPWQRERFWLEDVSADVSARPAGRRAGTHPLLGERLDSATQPGTHHWQVDFDKRTSHLGDHRIGGVAVAPGSALVEMAIAAAAEVQACARPSLFELHFRERLTVPDRGGRRVQTVLARDDEQVSVRIFTQGSETVCVAEVQVAATPAGKPEALDIAALQARMTETLGGGDLYGVLTALDLDYGPAFQGIESIARCDSEALARLRLPAAVADETDDYRVHPSLLDAALQVALAPALGPDWGSGGTRSFLTLSIGGVVLHEPHGETAWAHAIVRPDGDDDRALVADVRIAGDDGEPFVDATGVRIMSLERSPAARRRSVDATPATDRGAAIRQTLLALDGEQERCAVLEDVICANVGEVVKLAAARIDRDRPLSALGIDSIMSLELRNRLEAALGVALSATLIFNYPTVREIAPFLLSKMGLAVIGDAAADDDHEPEPQEEELAACESDEQAVASVAAMAEELAELTRELESI